MTEPNLEMLRDEKPAHVEEPTVCPRDLCVHELFERQVERTPGAVAVLFEGESLTYAELNARANRLAHHLRERGVGPDVRVAICVERGPEIVVGLLAVLKAGGAYVPLDPAYPEERLGYMLRDSAPAAVLTQSSLASRFAGVDLPVLDLQARAPAWTSAPQTNPARERVGLMPDHPAYVIYTSGSTGRPKGVHVEHRSLASTLVTAREAFGFGPGDRVISLASFAFDIWLFESVLPLLAGSLVRLVSREQVLEVPRLVQELSGCTAVHAVPVLMRRIVQEVRATAAGTLRGMRRMFVGGDAVAPELLEEMREAFPEAEVHVLYGPTEGTIICAAHRLGEERATRQMVGRPLGNAALHVLDADGGPVPVGVAGELYVGGAGVARGYLHRPELTAERFVPDPFGKEAGGRLYRTGDLGRWLPDGTIEFLGRNDAQVKVRGFRIEPGEIEARLLEHEGVREAVVAAREDSPGDRRLVAYWVGADGVGVERLRAHLSERLPEYMAPAAYVRLEALPLTPNGKVDRRVLPAPERDAYADAEFEAPVGELEEALAEIWAEVLRVERVGRRDDFFKLGGHSLLIVRVLERMRHRGLHAEVRALFMAPTLAELASAVVGTAPEVEVPPNGIPEACDSIRPEMLPLVELDPSEIERIVEGVPGGAGNVQDVYPLAPLQEGFLFHHLLANEGDPYLSSEMLGFDSREHLDAFLGALQAVVDGHDILRTAVMWEGLREPVQVVLRRVELVVEEVELDAAGGDVGEQLYSLYDPRWHRIDIRRAPLMRICVARDEPRGRWLLLLLVHHVMMDHEAMDVLAEEVAAHLEGRAEALPPALPFRSYVAQARLGVSREEHEAFFRDMLGDVEEPTAPFGLMNAWSEGARSDLAVLEVDPTLVARLRSRGRALGMSAASLCHLAWAQVLARVTGREDVVFGTVLFGRMRAGEGSDRVLGPYMNTVPVRIRVGDEGAEASVRRTRRLLANLLEHEHAPLALAQRCSGVPAPEPLFSALLNFRHTVEIRGPWACMEGVERLRWDERSTYSVVLSVDDLGEQGLCLTAQVHGAAVARRLCAQMHTALERLVEALELSPERPVGSIDVLPEAERRQVVEEWNATEAEYPRDACVHELFERQAERTPGAVAVLFEGESLTYAELNARANRLAHHLRALGVGPDARVAICVERSLEMVVALLAVLKAGGAYVALDPEYPAERLRSMLQDSAPAVVLTQERLAERFAGTEVSRVALDTDARSWARLPETNPEQNRPTPEHLCYVIYTSGSTGAPKGVMNVHRNVVNRITGIHTAWELEAHESVLQNASLSFDVSAYEFFWPLMVGARVVMTRPEGHKDPDYLVETIRRNGVGTASFVPSMLQLFLEHPEVESCASLVRVPCGGEALPPALVQRFGERLPNAKLYNRYGPSEAATAVTGWSRAAEEGRASAPIGRPMANTRVYMLDGGGEPVPVGVVGELYVGGAGVGRGYLNRPELTAERFVPDVFDGEAGARLYRTGDLARWLEDGRIEFLGRNDFQVKIRGFRVELSEIEEKLSGHAQVRDAVVLAREDVPGDMRLVAYYVGEEGLRVQALREHLSERLPEYMVPAAYVRLEEMPLTPNGKLDRRALPAPEGEAFARRGYEEPLGEVEEALAEIWAEVLRVERVGRRDHFFELGGHSLLAVRVVSRVRQRLGVEVPLAEVFRVPVLAEYARRVAAAGRAELPPIEPVERTGPLPLSFAQQRLWFLEQMGGLGSAYHTPWRLRLKGPLDAEALRRALERIVARHEVLRTSFPLVDGDPVQRIAPVEESGFTLAEHDLREQPGAEAELHRLLAEEWGAPFDLGRGPLIRGCLIRLGEDEHVLHVTVHHIVSDGWSTGLWARELSELYGAYRRGEADPLPALPVQYADYAVWQRLWVDGEVLREQAEYWKQRLAGAPELLELPTDRPRPAQPDFAGAFAGIVLGEELAAGLKALSQRRGTTLFMTLLAGWAVVLSRLSGQEEVVVGTPTANRGQTEIEGLIGFFVNTLALRLDLSGAPRVGKLLGQVKARALEAQQHQDIPFEQVVEIVQPVRSLAHSPLFQVAFAWQNVPGDGLDLPGLEVAVMGEIAEEAGAKFDLSLWLGESGGRIVGGVQYATSLYERATVERHAGYLRRVLEAVVAEPERRITELEMLSEAERGQVLEVWNDTGAAYPSGVCVHELFQAQAERTPDAVAVVHGERSLTYAELNARANRLAHHLRARGAGPESRVAVLVPRSIELVVAELAILKAGAAYVPIDPSFPTQRIASVLADSGARIVLGLEGEELPDFGTLERLDVDAPREGAADDPRVPLDSEAAAYVMYTSGSTGEPKGVVVPHRAITRLVLNNGYAEFGTEDRVAFGSNPAFDASTMEVWAPLLNGGRIVVIGADVLLDPQRFGQELERQGVSVLWLTVGLFNQYADELKDELGRLRYLIVGGDALDPRVIARVLAGRRPVHLLNGYGPTETTTFAVTHEIRSVEEGARSIPLGRPMANARIYILDRAGAPVPLGAAGELYIGGAGVARGYLNRAELTAERFVPDAFSGEPGARLYRTGDLGRWRAEGTLEFLGRNDAQVKVRGFRIELGEIEAVLAEHPQVREAVVLAREDAPGDRRLVAYYLGAEAVETEMLREHLSERLPEYMVPAAYVRLEEMPLTPNGKLDRRALSAPEEDAYARRGYETPVGEVEEALAGIWAEVLRVERVGRWDHFFELGGHSLLAVQVVSRLRQRLGAEVPLGELFGLPVLTEYARRVAAAARADLPPIERVDRTAPLPLSFAQQRLWFLEQLGGVGSAYHIPWRLRLRGELDGGALRRALERIVARHEVLRTTFSLVDGDPVQRIAPVEERRFCLTEHDLSREMEAEEELHRLMAEEWSTPFDLERGPLIRGRLIHLGSQDHVLLVSMHHIVSDGWSMGVLTQELSVLYGAFRRGEADPLPALAVQYGDYAVWQRRWVDGEVLREQAEYWKRALSGAPELLELPTDRARPAEMDHAGATLDVDLGEELTAGLKALAQRQGTTLFMTLLAGWAVVLSRLSGQEDLVIGTPSANRNRVEIEPLIGFFVNTLVLRVDLSGAPSVAELQERTKAQVLVAQAHAELPFEQVVEQVQPVRSLSHSPLFQAMFAWQNTPRAALELAGLRLAPVGKEGERCTSKYDLTLTLGEGGGRIQGGLTYATALYERVTAERYLSYLRRALEGMVADAERTVQQLPLLSEEERRQVVVEWNATAAEFPGDVCIHELFEAQVEHTPGAVAVIYEDQALTYAELNVRANRLAHVLRKEGVGPESRVALVLERSSEMVVGILGVLKSGGCYVPVDPDSPPERIAYTLSNAGAEVVLTQESVRGRLPDGLPEVLCLDAMADVLDAESTGNPSVIGGPESLAYVIYTSGSTGWPKGVLIEHRGLVNYARSVAERIGHGEGRNWALLSTVAADLGNTALYPALLSGGTLHVISRERAQDPESYAAYAEENEIDCLKIVPSHLAALLACDRPERVLPRRRLVLGGEASRTRWVEELARLRPGCAVMNHYGPTETTVGVLTHRFGGEETETLPLGTPLANTRVYVLDAQGEPVPVGVAGELHIAGVQVARGYLNQPELTRERFVPDPFSGEAGGRMYRTGDRGRWRSDGSIEFLGRADHQVKVRGFRIELGEIEARLLEHEGVREAVVVAREDDTGDRRLVAYWVGAEEGGAERLRAHLSERLPEYMVPAAYVRLEEMPLTPNGKLDRKALPAPEEDAYARCGYEAPLGEVEEALAAIWAEVLGVERVGRRDNFFELGGHSLLAIRVLEQMRRWGLYTGARALFTKPTIAGLATDIVQEIRL